MFCRRRTSRPSVSERSKEPFCEIRLPVSLSTLTVSVIVPTPRRRSFRTILSVFFFQDRRQPARCSSSLRNPLNRLCLSKTRDRWTERKVSEFRRRHAELMRRSIFVVRHNFDAQSQFNNVRLFQLYNEHWLNGHCSVCGDIRRL